MLMYSCEYTVFDMKHMDLRNKRSHKVLYKWRVQLSIFQTWYDDRYYLTLHLDTSKTELMYDSKPKWSKKENTFVPITSQSLFNFILMEFVVLLRLVDLMNLLLILCCPINIQGKEPYSGIFFWSLPGLMFISACL